MSHLWNKKKATKITFYCFFCTLKKEDNQIRISKGIETHLYTVFTDFQLL